MSSPQATAIHVGGAPPRFLTLLAAETRFLSLLLAGLCLAAVTYEVPHLAMWVGFLFAAYAATANDSIQTIGTFMASNAQRPWWALWLYIGGIFLATMLYGWFAHDGDVSFQRLSAKGFEAAPTQFTYLQVVAPLGLLVLTRFGMPVSTTFLCLSGFATTAASIGSILQKSVFGYGVAFTLSLLLWAAASRWSGRLFTGRAHSAWTPIQWATSGALWSVWLMQDAANVAVFLPRRLDAIQFAGFAGIMLAGLGLLFYLRGDRIQQVVESKTNVVDVRVATLLDVTYAGILWYFKSVSNVPMSTTWVFLGLLAGREVGLALMGAHAQGLSHALRLIGRDLVAVTTGLVVSILLAIAVNPTIRDGILALLP